MWITPAWQYVSPEMFVKCTMETMTLTGKGTQNLACFV